MYNSFGFQWFNCLTVAAYMYILSERFRSLYHIVVAIINYMYHPVECTCIYALSNYTDDRNFKRN